MEFSRKLLIFASTRKKKDGKGLKSFTIMLSTLDNIHRKNMLGKLYLSILVALCSVSAFALNLNTLQGAEDDSYAEHEDTSSHSVFHSKFGDDVEFPRLTGNAGQNAAILSNFFTKISMKNNTRIETFIALIPLVPKSGDDISRETLDKMLPISYRCYYSASMEYLLFCQMGGKNKTLRQIFYAFRSETSITFTPLCHKYPDVYCAQLDSVSAFLKNLDYIGNIYPEINGIKSKETQDTIVRKLVDGIEKIKINMRKNAERDRKFREFAWQLYKDPGHLDIHKYFSEKMCKKIEDKEFDVKSIAPNPNWANWDVNDLDLCSFSFERLNTFQVILSNKPRSDSLLDADSSREVLSYFLIFMEDGDRTLIDDVNVQTVAR